MKSLPFGKRLGLYTLYPASPPHISNQAKSEPGLWRWDSKYHASLSDTSILCADFSNLRFSWLASPVVEPLCHKLGQGCLGLQYSRCSAPEIESLFHRQMLNREWSLHHSTALAWDLSVAIVTYVLGSGGWEMVISCSSWEEKFSDWELGENRVLLSWLYQCGVDSSPSWAGRVEVGKWSQFRYRVCA